MLIVALLVGGLILREVLRWVAESGLLAPTWLAVIAIVLALGVWFFAPAGWTGRSGNLAQYLPKPVIDYMNSPNRSFAAAALAPDSEPEPNTADGPAAGSTRLRLSSSRSRSGEGEPVTFTARLSAGGVAIGERRAVRFYSGTTLLGSAILEGEEPVASLTVTTLLPGDHENQGRKSSGRRGLGTDRSPAVSHRVVAVNRR